MACAAHKDTTSRFILIEELTSDNYMGVDAGSATVYCSCAECSPSLGTLALPAAGRSARDFGSAEQSGSTAGG